MKCLFTSTQKRQNMLKSSLLFKKIINFPVNNLGILRFKIAKFSGYYVYMEPIILGDFHIYISVPLRSYTGNSKRN